MDHPNLVKDLVSVGSNYVSLVAILEDTEELMKEVLPKWKDELDANTLLNIRRNTTGALAHLRTVQGIISGEVRRATERKGDKLDSLRPPEGHSDKHR